MPNSLTEFIARIEPYLYQVLVGVLLVGAGAFGFKYLSAATGSTTYLGNSRVVVFDVVKLANAQRKIAAAFLGRDTAAAGEQATLLLEIQGRTQKVIRDIAGPGTIVLVKQAVIHTELEDITDAVLKELRLPVDVPTQDPVNSGVDYSPTILGMTKPPQSNAERRALTNPLSGGGSVLP